MDDQRRRFLARASRAAMGVGPAGGYGGFALIASRFLHPARPQPTMRQFVTTVDRLRVGDSVLCRAPNGESIHVTHQGSQATGGEYVALSSTCPHLGCRVHWEPRNNRYFCPCHGGVFDPSGVATGGPPGDAGQSVPRYPLHVQDGRIFVEVPEATLLATRRSR